MQTSLTLTRSHDLYPTRWCDLFDLTSWVGEGWLLLDLPGAPCDVTQPQMRTMTQRLRKAQECAAAGGKYGLLQAVLLSMDSQPSSPAQWLRQCVALEACSKVLLPAAHEDQVDLAVARVAYQQLTPAEQRLWRQLQQARIQTKRSCNMTAGAVESYLPDLSHTANVLAGVTGDVALHGHETMRRLLFGCCWELACRLIKRYCSVEDPDNPPSMQAAYNWALAAYQAYGKDHPETKAALAATKAADPESWVPRLLAGLTFPPPSMAPASVPGSKMEAAGYTHHFGMLWATDQQLQMLRMMDMTGDCYQAFSAPLKWLLKGHGIKVPSQQLQDELVGLRHLNCGDPHDAHGYFIEDILHIMRVGAAGPWPRCPRQVERLGLAKVLRTLAAYLLSAAAVTMNLPPITTAPRLWEAVGIRLGLGSLPRVAGHFKVLAMGVAQFAITLIPAVCTKPDAAGAGAAAAAGSSKLPSTSEQLELLMLLPFLEQAAARWVWQCGDAGMAQKVCSMEPNTALSMVRAMVVKEADVLEAGAADGVIVCSTQPIDELAEFVRQEAAAQRPGANMQLIQEALEADGRGRTAAAAAILTAAGDPQEQRLYDLFPTWLDQLVSQVAGRRVTLVIEPKAAFSLIVEEQNVTGMYLKDAATGTKQLFGWRRPGYANGASSYQGLMMAAMGRGVTDYDLLQYSAAIEPYQAPAAGSGGNRSASSSSSPRLPVRRPKPSSEQAAPAAAAAGGSAAASATTSRRAAPSAAAAQQQQPGAATGVVGSNGSSEAKPSRACAQCGELFPKLLRCTRCKAVSYCTKECQVAHWKAGHKKECKELSA